MDSTSVDVIEPDDIKAKWREVELDAKYKKKHGIRLDGIISTFRFLQRELNIIREDNIKAGREEISFLDGTIQDATSGIDTMVEELEYMESEILDLK
jgi:hypothetical protein